MPPYGSSYIKLNLIWYYQHVTVINLEAVFQCRYPDSADMALLAASVHIKKGDLAAADQMLTGLHSDTPATALRGVLMRAQLAVTGDKQQQVIAVHQLAM